MNQEKFAEKIICEGRDMLRQYLEEFMEAYPKVGLGYFKGKWKKILENFDAIQKEGAKRNLIVSKAEDGSPYLFFEYNVEAVNK